MTALSRYNANMEGEVEPDSIERLRFFLSLALTGQDWIDVEQFIDGVSEQLAAALAACKLKDEAIQIAVDYARDFEEADFLLGEEALAIQPDDSALKAWLGEPIAHVDEDDNNKWATLVDDLDIKFGTPLYSPKGMTK